MEIITPDWPAPENIVAAITTREGGVSLAPWDTLNISFNTKDKHLSIEKNWQLLSKELNLPSLPQVLDQVHGIDIVRAHSGGSNVIGDGSFSDLPKTVCAVTTADCLPMLVCNIQGTLVCAVHAGWRGLSTGIVKNIIRQLAVLPSDLMVYLGPAISQKNFEVGFEVKNMFISSTSKPCLKEKFNSCFLRIEKKEENEVEKWQADLYGLAKMALNEVGIAKVYGGDFCTYGDPVRFYSHRRDGETGRRASLIWIS